MKIVIETEDFVSVDSALKYLFNMQRESDEYAAMEPREHKPGYGPLSLGTEQKGIAARVVGILHPRETRITDRRAYEIQTIRGETE